jgi:uncharacterized OB-fold protein
VTGSVEGAVILLPARGSEGRRREGPDEDRFTLVVAAAERLERRCPPSGVARIHLFGGFPAEAVATIGVAVGAPEATVRIHDDTAPELEGVLGSPEGAGGAGSELLLFGEALAEGPPATVARDAGAVAIRRRAGGNERVPSSGARLPAPRKLGADGSALARAVAWVARDAELVVPPPAGPEPSVDGGAEPPPVRLDFRSEGAYVPRARYLENLPSRWRFAAERCAACSEVTFPRRGYCRHCGRADRLEATELPRDGAAVEAVTTVRPGAQPTEFDWQVARRGAYDVALVRFAGGARATLQVTDTAPGALPRGATVATVLRRLYPMEGAWRYGRKAVAAPPTAPTAE